jgi:hypothetical protein
MLSETHTAKKTLYRKVETNIPINETSRPRSTHVSVSDLYFPTIGHRIHEYGKWERGCAVSFLETHKLDLVCSAYNPSFATIAGKKQRHL